MLKLVYSQEEVILNKSIIFNTLFKALPLQGFFLFNQSSSFRYASLPFVPYPTNNTECLFYFSTSLLALFESSLPNIQSNDKIDQINIFVHNCIKSTLKKNSTLTIK